MGLGSARLVVMTLFAFLLLGGAFLLLAAYDPFALVAGSTCLSAVLVAVCWLKGEHPSWRRGRK